MRDDPTDQNATDTLGAQLEAFRQEPGDADLFRELRTTLKRAGQPRALAEITELHAPCVEDKRQTVQLWYEGGLLRQEAEQLDLAERDFRRRWPWIGGMKRQPRGSPSSSSPRDRLPKQLTSLRTNWPTSTTAPEQRTRPSLSTGIELDDIDNSRDSGTPSWLELTGPFITGSARSAWSQPRPRL